MNLISLLHLTVPIYPIALLLYLLAGYKLSSIHDNLLIYILLIYALIAPQWSINNGNCILTNIELAIKGIPIKKNDYYFSETHLNKVYAIICKVVEIENNHEGKNKINSFILMLNIFILWYIVFFMKNKFN